VSSYCIKVSGGISKSKKKSARLGKKLRAKSNVAGLDSYSYENGLDSDRPGRRQFHKHGDALMKAFEMAAKERHQSYEASHRQPVPKRRRDLAARILSHKTVAQVKEQQLRLATK